MAWSLQCRRCLSASPSLTQAFSFLSCVHSPYTCHITASLAPTRTYGDVANQYSNPWSHPAMERVNHKGRWLRQWRWLCSKLQAAEFTEEQSILRSISDLHADAFSSQTTKASSFKVVEVSADGTILELVRTPLDLRLQPRDVSLFTSHPRFSTQRATIAARDGSILFRTEMGKAIITSDRAVLFQLRRQRDTVKLVEGVLSRVMHPSAVPFEFRVLEAMLEATTVYFEKRAKRVRVLLESVIHEINAQHHIDANVSEFQR